MTALQEIPVKRIDGRPAKLADFAGKVLLVVNVASECGLTPQYVGLESLYRKYADRGLIVLGFPANDFGAQEPGTNAQIAQFCQTRFDVTFPMFEKITVKGSGKHPLYERLTNTPPGGEISWNFEKFVVGKDGNVAARFAPQVAPEDPKIIQTIEAELAK